MTACIKLIGIYSLLISIFSFSASLYVTIYSLASGLESNAFLFSLLSSVARICLSLFVIFEAERITRWIRISDVAFDLDIQDVLRIGLTLFGVSSFIRGVSATVENSGAWTGRQEAQMPGFWAGVVTLILAVALIKFAPRIASFINQQQKVSDLSEADVL